LARQAAETEQKQVEALLKTVEDRIVWLSVFLLTRLPDLADDGLRAYRQRFDPIDKGLGL